MLTSFITKQPAYFVKNVPQRNGIKRSYYQNVDSELVMCYGRNSDGTLIEEREIYLYRPENCDNYDFLIDLNKKET